MWKPTLSHAELQRRTPATTLGSTGRSVPVLIAIATWLVATAWWRPLALPDEGRYDGVAWEMVHARDWLVPTLDGLPFFHKPPPWYWLAAAAMSVFGTTNGPLACRL